MERVIYYGESLGSGVRCSLLPKPHPSRSSWKRPIARSPDVAARRFRYVPVRRLLRDRFDSIAKVAAIETPLLIIHGEKDQTVPIGLGHKLFAAAREPKQQRIFPEAAHIDLYDFGAADGGVEFLRVHAPGCAAITPV